MQLAEVMETRDLGPDVREMVLRPLERAVDHVAGQWVALHLPLAPKPVVRAYTLAEPGGATGDRMVLCFDRVRGGAVSSYLFSLGPGDVVPMSDPQGSFVLPSPMPRGLVMVGWFTGIVPFRCMVLAGKALGALPPTLMVCGAARPEELVYRDDLQQLAREVPGFQYVPVVAPAERAVEAVTAALPGAVAGAFPGGLASGREHAMVCGLRAFVLPVRQWLVEVHGLDRLDIHKELYD